MVGKTSHLLNGGNAWPTRRRFLRYNPGLYHNGLNDPAVPELYDYFLAAQMMRQYDVTLEPHNVNPHSTNRKAYALIHPQASGLVLGTLGRLGIDRLLLASPNMAAGAERNCLMIEMAPDDPRVTPDVIHTVLGELANGAKYDVPGLPARYRVTGSLYVPQIKSLGLEGHEYQQFDRLPDTVAKYGFPLPAMVGCWLTEPNQIGSVCDVITPVH